MLRTSVGRASTASTLVRGLGVNLRGGGGVNGGLAGNPQGQHLVISRTFFLSAWRRAATAYAGTTPEEQQRKERDYHWVSPEAQRLISRAYNRHKALADTGETYPPSLSVKHLETGLAAPSHYEPRDMLDRIALKMMKFLRIFTHAFFRKKYDHHAVVLETVAAVPGIVGAMHRHLRSLRRMERDHGWINPLLEEAENERMHLLIWMQVTKPTILERSLVMVAQGMYVVFYMGLYLTTPRGAHRLVGYLEEEAHLAYSDYLRGIDAGEIANKPAPEIAKQYYRLPDDATIRDVVLHVRADECMHRDFNHMLSDKYKRRDLNSRPTFMGEDFREEEVIASEMPFDPEKDVAQFEGKNAEKLESKHH
mmetsp:Transcript_2292/g.6864  ORF Transcript_2292/g.6864 Transcript_2292/m.6864 type:complete len:365 (+) Transcript_2292:80-1174(+)